jgi:peptidoglycan/xylan/chitin deacetylase (PgdA/CDA1 family)
MSDGSTEYEILGLPYVSTGGTVFTSKFSVPAGAQTITIYHFIQSVGSLTLDDASLTPYTPTGFSSALVTLTFDDGYETEYSNALPILQQYGLKSTQFVITNEIGKASYMTAAQLKTLYQNGNEIASHTVTHSDLTQETATQLSTEMTQSKTTLQTDTGESITDMAYPYGLYNTNVVNAAKAVYTSARGVESGLNSKDNFDQYDLKVEDVYTTTTTAQIADWVAQAQATKTWLIFVYHGVDTDVNNPVDGDIYDVPPAQLSAQMAAIKASGVTVETLNNALATVKAQMGTAAPTTVTFNANGGLGTMAAETASAPTALTSNKYIRLLYTFNGWNTAANGTGTAYANGATYPFTTSTTLYAQWKII